MLDEEEARDGEFGEGEAAVLMAFSLFGEMPMSLQALLLRREIGCCEELWGLADP